VSSPDPLAGFQGPLRSRGGEEKVGEGRRKERAKGAHRVFREEGFTRRL